MAYEYNPQKPLFKALSDEEEQEFAAYAREKAPPMGTAFNRDIHHPVCCDQWERLGFPEVTGMDREIYEYEETMPYARYILIRGDKRGQFRDPDGNQCSLLSINGNSSEFEVRWWVACSSGNRVICPQSNTGI